jgi:hypothetical protein
MKEVYGIWEQGEDGPNLYKMIGGWRKLSNENVLKF